MVKSIPASLTCEGDFEVLDIPTCSYGGLIIGGLIATPWASYDKNIIRIGINP